MNLRPPAPHAGALAELRYAPEAVIIFDLRFLDQTQFFTDPRMHMEHIEE